jgi:solute carrier family 25 (mitochondrial phosphate transporter), member 3
VGEETAHKYRTTLYLTASASAEFFADILLCPWEAIKVRMQTTIPPFARGTLEGWNKIHSTEGMAGYLSLPLPLSSQTLDDVDIDVCIDCIKDCNLFGEDKFLIQ